MGKRSFAKKLPQDLREELDRQIMDGKLGVDDLWTWLRERGVEVGRSSVHRHMQSVEDVVAEMRQAREAAGAIVGQLGPEAAEGKVGQMLIEVVQNIAWKVARQKLTGDGETMGMDELMFLTSAVQKLASAQSTDTTRRQKIEDAALKQAASRVDSVGKSQGWSAETAAMVRAQIMGVKITRVAGQATTP